MATRGAEIVRGDLEDKTSLIAAFKGAHAIFTVTDFWTPFRDQKNFTKADEAGKTINEYAYDVEVRQGRNVAEAAAEPSVLQTLEHFVFSALSDVRKWSKGKDTWAYHFDSKAKIVEYIRQDSPELDKRMSTVQMGHYVTNWRTTPALAPQK